MFPHTAVVGLLAIGACPATGVPVIVTPFMDVALMIPDPLTVSVPPVPTVNNPVLVPGETPLKGTAVAVIVPLPLVPRLPPVPIVNGVVFVPVVTPPKGTLVAVVAVVAAIVPDPLVAIEHPVPQTIAAIVFVPLVIAPKEEPALLPRGAHTVHA
jgi:hypothetical protein